MIHRRFKNTWVARTTEFSQKVIEKIEKSRKTIFSMSSDYSYVLIIFQGENKKTDTNYSRFAFYFNSYRIQKQTISTMSVLQKHSGYDGWFVQLCKDGKIPVSRVDFVVANQHRCQYLFIVWVMGIQCNLIFKYINSHCPAQNLG